MTPSRSVSNFLILKGIHDLCLPCNIQSERIKARLCFNFLARQVHEFDLNRSWHKERSHEAKHWNKSFLFSDIHVLCSLKLSSALQSSSFEIAKSWVTNPLSPLTVNFSKLQLNISQQRHEFDEFDLNPLWHKERLYEAKHRNKSFHFSDV